MRIRVEKAFPWPTRRAKQERKGTRKIIRGLLRAVGCGLQSFERVNRGTGVWQGGIVAVVASLSVGHRPLEYA